MSTNDMDEGAQDAPPLNNRGWANVKKYAQEHTEEALEKLAELIHAENSCISYAASKLFLERGHGRVPPALLKRARQVDGQGPLNVKITRFSEGIIYDKRNRHHELPVVYGGWQGPRDLGDAGDTRLPTLPGQRPGVRDQPGVHDGTATGLQRAGAACRRGGGNSASGINRDGSACSARQRVDQEQQADYCSCKICTSAVPGGRRTDRNPAKTKRRRGKK